MVVIRTYYNTMKTTMILLRSTNHHHPKKDVPATIPIIPVGYLCDGYGFVGIIIITYPPLSTIPENGRN